MPSRYSKILLQHQEESRGAPGGGGGGAGSLAAETLARSGHLSSAGGPPSPAASAPVAQQMAIQSSIASLVFPSTCPLLLLVNTFWTEAEAGPQSPSVAPPGFPYSAVCRKGRLLAMRLHLGGQAYTASFVEAILRSLPAAPQVGC